MTIHVCQAMGEPLANSNDWITSSRTFQAVMDGPLTHACTSNSVMTSMSRERRKAITCFHSFGKTNWSGFADGNLSGMTNCWIISKVQSCFIALRLRSATCQNIHLVMLQVVQHLRTTMLDDRMALWRLWRIKTPRHDYQSVLFTFWFTVRLRTVSSDVRLGNTLTITEMIIAKLLLVLDNFSLHTKAFHQRKGLVRLDFLGCTCSWMKTFYRRDSHQAWKSLIGFLQWEHRRAWDHELEHL